MELIDVFKNYKGGDLKVCLKSVFDSIKSVNVLYLTFFKESKIFYAC